MVERLFRFLLKLAMVLLTILTLLGNMHTGTTIIAIDQPDNLIGLFGYLKLRYVVLGTIFRNEKKS